MIRAAINYGHLMALDTRMLYLGRGRELLGSAETYVL